jgi:hypothetical protein
MGQSEVRLVSSSALSAGTAGTVALFAYNTGSLHLFATTPDGTVYQLTPPGAGSGEANTASNVGTGVGVFKQKSVVDLQFKTLSGSYLGGLTGTLINNTNEIVIQTDASPLSGTIDARFTNLSGTINAAIINLSGTINAEFIDLSGTIDARFSNFSPGGGGGGGTGLALTSSLSAQLVTLASGTVIDMNVSGTIDWFAPILAPSTTPPRALTASPPSKKSGGYILQSLDWTANGASAFAFPTSYLKKAQTEDNLPNSALTSSQGFGFFHASISGYGLRFAVPAGPNVRRMSLFTAHFSNTASFTAYLTDGSGLTSSLISRMPHTVGTDLRWDVDFSSPVGGWLNCVFKIDALTLPAGSAPSFVCSAIVLSGALGSGSSGLTSVTHDHFLTGTGRPEEPLTVRNRANLWDYPNVGMSHVMDEEFETSTLLTGNFDNAWIVANNTITYGISPYVGFSTGSCRVAFDMRPSWMMVQPPGTGASTVFLKKALLLSGSDFFMWSRLASANRATSVTAGDGLAAIIMGDSGTLDGNAAQFNNFVGLISTNAVAGNIMQYAFYKTQGGVVTVQTSGEDMFINRNVAQPYATVGIQKIGTTYHGWGFDAGGNRTWMGSQTWTGSLNYVGVFFVNASNASPGNLVHGVDFLRFRTGSTWLP